MILPDSFKIKTKNDHITLWPFVKSGSGYMCHITPWTIEQIECKIRCGDWTIVNDINDVMTIDEDGNIC